MKRPFVIVVASEKGGVGKTTIATNLAVYLKALREDLPVTIASFDNHFSVDQMFALGPKPASGIADLVDGQWNAEDVSLGQYGVQYLASSRRLMPPAQRPVWLRQRLARCGLSGVMILDTRPILDWFAEAAILAADLVLVPVKDRAALINAAAIRQILEAVGRADCLWLVPSLVDSRARLNAEIKVHEFLRYAARERDYQVSDLHISKSPKVESLASGFSSRIMPILTHARQTVVHGQFRQLAEFVLGHFDAVNLTDPQPADSDPPLASRRLIPECPVCQQRFDAQEGHYFFTLHSRNRGFLHPGCFADMFAGLELVSMIEGDSLVGLTIEGPGLVGPEINIVAHLIEPTGALSLSESIALEECPGIAEALKLMSGRSLERAYHDLVLVRAMVIKTDEQLSGQGLHRFRGVRRRVLREMRQAGVL